ncbi:glycoside hydrolase family 2 TIM barrel-domain containing protein [Anaerobium acetethylicum]|uniref:Glycosyl hydrolases family 2 n=1 Tax=Anaerobium acetethylicum TaxID=1619234 RepID=A0A1D3TX32_9FIRM|nr:glycoside hydrolase family 2 TIM barrel-domain containing protein [Anaerobium acetethylicum]SCP98857.1 Glycosyl hydrolases family 2 [Anaerobium acetethylicum]
MQKLSFNDNWMLNGEVINLPHDAMIKEKRSKATSDGGHGYFPGGIYTYSKSFMAPLEWEDKEILIEFEGVYRNATVHLNGKEIGKHAYGYTGFALPLTDLILGEENLLTVVADNSKTPNSRWYTGSGIYRPVWLYIGRKDGIPYDGIKITTLSLSPATIQVTVNAENAKVEIYEGNTLLASALPGVIELPDAKLWSADEPNLYTCRVSIGDDVVEETFGIREIKWSPQGLLINSQEVLLRGGCVHHDHGILGAACYDESEWRRVRILKEAGFNAIRSSHNPCSRAMLEACDYYGMYVMDESFDMWYNRKTTYDYGLDFESQWKKDTAEMVRKDYNHPSVIFYSIGNEVAEPAEAKGLDYGKQQVNFIHYIDSTRPVTCGLNLMIISRAAKGQGIYQDGTQKNSKKENKAEDKAEDKATNGSLAFNIMASIVGSSMNKAGNSPKVDALASPMIDALDIAGYNYGSGRYPLEGKLHPKRMLIGSETFPQDIYKNWEQVKKYPYLFGDFMWTSWDYLGEAGLGCWSYAGGMPFNRPYPWILSGSGVIDITGKPDGSCRYTSTVWGLETAPRIAVKPVNHPGVRVSKSVWRGTNAIESWAWNNCVGNKAEIEVYSDSAYVELLLGEKSLGKKKVKECKAIYKIKYVPETLTAIAYSQNGNELGRRSLEPATGALRLRMIPENSQSNIHYIPIEIVGENGIVESNADRLLNVSVSGGTLLGFGSGNPCHEESYHTGSFTSYYGRSLAVVKTDDKASNGCTVSVTDGKLTSTITI